MIKPIQGQSGAAMVHSNIGQLARAEFLKMWPFMGGKTLDEIYAFGRERHKAARAEGAPLAGTGASGPESVRSLPVGNHGDNNL
ncbi:hypothetical protein [Polaromonas sp.]|uniref:hypothetical protein n=1 Tax=Polaromonas sp. TaxID=1869339 RepID=UPI00273144FA|nr:hypothetical protein [Polaromonas sp.]MDP1888731.1 hypothetical protein [Polaromonas sp.]